MPYAQPIPSCNILKNRRKNSESVEAEHSALGPLRYVLDFRNREGIAVANVGIQHHVNIRAGVAAVNDMVGPDLRPRLQLIENENLSISRSGASNGFNFTGFVVLKFRAVNVAFGNHSLKRGLHNLYRCGRKNVEVEMVPRNPALQNLVQQC